MISKLLKGNYILLYYLILLLVIAFWSSESEPPSAIRYGYLLAFFLPLLTKYLHYYPACLICFMAISTNGYAFGFFPYAGYLYLVITLIGLYFAPKLSKPDIPVCVKIIVGYLFLVNTATSGNPQNIFYSSLVVLFFSYYTIRDRVQGVRLMLNCFCIVALTLSVVYYLNYDRFLVSYNGLADIERSGWTDPNYLSCIIGMGVITSLLLIVKSQDSHIALKIFWIVTIAVSFSAQLLIASRGALLAEVLAIPLIISTTHMTGKRKILIFLSLVVFVYWLYTNSYFELMEYRIMNDSGTGGGRSVIWEQKLNAFFDANFFSQIFGYGYEGGLYLGTGIMFGFHNDYIAILCDYGFIGLALFLCCLFYPIFKAPQQVRSEVFALVAYLAVVCFSLEPISSGRLPYFGFFFMIMLYSKSANMVVNNSRLENGK